MSGCSGVIDEQVGDSSKARFPQNADCLIWEESPKASRLCKMEKGKWSVAPHAPVQIPPKLIVTDGNHGVVFLFCCASVGCKRVVAQNSSNVQGTWTGTETGRI